MNRRERVRAALAHKQPDRVPIDLGGMGSTGIMAVAYSELRDHLQLPAKTVRINDVGQQLAEIDQDVLERVQADVININRTLPPTSCSGAQVMDFPLKNLSTQKAIAAEMLCEGLNIRRGQNSWELLDGKGDVEFVKPDDVYYFDRKKHQLAEAVTCRDIQQGFNWGLPDAAYLDALRQRALYLRDNTDYALMGSFGGSILETGQCLRGWGQFMMDLALGGPFVHYLLDTIADHSLQMLGLYLEAVGDCLDVIVFGDDLGTQAAPQMSLDLYRQTIHPRHKKLYQFVREHYPQTHVFLHSCGAIYNLIPMLIDEGVQILNPVQIAATGMDPQALKNAYGKDICFWGGGVDTQHVLPGGSPQEVREQVLRNMETFSPEGGFVFCQVHNIQASVPPENIISMYGAVHEFNQTKSALKNLSLSCARS